MTDNNVVANMDEKVKERAYKIWEQEGRPDGRHDEHWSQAKMELGSPDKAALVKKNNYKSMASDQKKKEITIAGGRESYRGAPAEKSYKSGKK